MKTAILLVNMGGALSQKKLKHFLFKMFTDVHILPFSKLPRYTLAFLISRLRYRIAWKKYKQIGGTPIIKDSFKLAETLQKQSNIRTDVAFSYSQPFIREKVQVLANEGIEQITVIPLYPQKSTTTTSSVVFDINALKEDFSQISFNVIQEFYQQDLFTEYWVEIIKTHLLKEQIDLECQPTLVFSAHSLPLSVIGKGDTYPQSVEQTAKNIANALNLEYRVVYQSKIKKSTWYGDEPDEVIMQLIQEDKENIIIIPISFISECLETIYDLDIDLIPNIQQKTNKKVHISRVHLPQAHPIFAKMLLQLHQNR